MVVFSVYVRSTKHAIDSDAFAEQLASGLNYSVAAADVHVDVQPLPDVCLLESSVRAHTLQSPALRSCHRALKTTPSPLPYTASTLYSYNMPYMPD